MKFKILGVTYTLEYKEKSKCKDLELCDGFCDCSTKAIVVRKYTKAEQNKPGTKHDLGAYQRKCMRHEIVHAFLYESGLDINALGVDCWPHCEELVDWMAIQGPKIYAAWQRAGCL